MTMYSLNYLVRTGLLFLFLFSCISYPFIPALHASENTQSSHNAPKVYVGRCGFRFNDKNCGDLTKSVIFDSSDELLSFTDNWAVGRAGSYKLYLSCFGPDDKEYIDGTLSSLTVVVAGPNLLEAHNLSSKLMTEFSDQLPNQSGSMTHCFEQ